MSGFRAGAVAIACALVVACGTSLQPEDPALVLKQGGAATASLHTVVATMKVTHGTITFQGFSLVSATASVRLPDESDTSYLVRDKDVQIGFEVVILNGRVFFKPPLLRFTELTGKDAAAIPDLAKLFDPVHGLPAVIPQGRNPQYEKVENVGGVDCHEVSALYTGAQINELLPQLGSQSDVTADVWVGGSDHLIRRAVLGGNFGDNGTLSTVEVDLSGFNSSVNIASPGRTS